MRRNKNGTTIKSTYPQRFVGNEQEIIDAYIKIGSIRKVASLFKTGHFTIQTIVADITRTRGNQGVSSIEGNPFACLSNEAYYWLGYLAGDGSVSATGNRNPIIITSKDEESILRFRNFIGEHDLIAQVNKVGVISYQFTSKEIRDYLIDFGITPNKDESVKLKTLNNHVVRGLFDADGNVCYNTGYKITSSSMPMVTDLINIINTIDGAWSVYPKVFPKGNSFDVYIRGHKGKIFKWLYKDAATVYLKRKYKTARAISL